MRQEFATRLKALVGMGLGGPSVLPSARARNGVTLGGPAWGPDAFLRDLELRLSLSPVVASAGARLPAWTARLKYLGDAGAFYARSLAVDELGTATTLLEWRDGLVDAGWHGDPIARGGERLDALVAIENHGDPKLLPIDRADRLARVEHALTIAHARLYDSIELVEDPPLWSGRWQRVFQCLEARGTTVRALTVELPGAAVATDLGALQARLRGETTSRAVRGDGTVLLLSGDTPGDLAELTAVLVADGRAAGSRDVVVRCKDAESLELALARHHEPALGCSGESVWRPALQILPLAIELAFEPRDPFRVLELLTLPVGPFRGMLGARLARAVARQPGIGGKEWLRQKADVTTRMRERYARREQEQGRSEADADAIAAARVDERMQQVADWLERPGVSPEGITRTELAVAVDRVANWLQSRIRSGELDAYGAAYAQTVGFARVVATESRERLTREEVRRLVDCFARAQHPHAISVETSGRVAHVHHPAALLAPCDRVFFYGFVAGVERRPARLPWNDAELAALRDAGVHFPDPASLLRAEATAWRRAVLAATECVVFVVPRTIKGTATTPHPLWDEIRARLGLDDEAVARVTRESRTILDELGAGVVRVEECAPLPLPEARGAWAIPPDALRASAGDRKTSVTALERIATCPLAWVFEQRADLRSGAMSRVATGPLLNGGLSHRLVELLHLENAFARSEVEFLARADALLEGLLRTEGASLLLDGASIERLQFTRQASSAMRDLHRYLVRSGFRIAGVEEEIKTDSVVGVLDGRLDLRLVDSDGRIAILDLKWGATTYRKLLARGHAVQLAAYSRAAATPDQAAPPAGYFSLAGRQVLATDPRMKPARTIEGPAIEQTWRRVEATARLVLASHEAGRVYVAATKRSLPLLDALAVPDGARAEHFDAAQAAACTYCDYDALCGRKWEALT